VATAIVASGSGGALTFQLHADTTDRSLGRIMGVLDSRGRGTLSWPDGAPRALLRESGVETFPRDNVAVPVRHFQETVIPTVSQAAQGARWSWRYRHHGKERPLEQSLEIRLCPGLTVTVAGMGRTVLSVAGHVDLPLGRSTLALLKSFARESAPLSSVPRIALAQSHGWSLPALSATGRELQGVATVVEDGRGKVSGLKSLVHNVCGVTRSVREGGMDTSLTRSKLLASSAVGRAGMSFTRSGAVSTVQKRAKAVVAPARVARRVTTAADVESIPASALKGRVASNGQRGKLAVLVAVLYLPTHSPSKRALDTAWSVSRALLLPPEAALPKEKASAVSLASSLSTDPARELAALLRLREDNAPEVLGVDCSRGSALASKLGVLNFPQWMVYCGKELVFAGPHPGEKTMRLGLASVSGLGLSPADLKRAEFLVEASLARGSSVSQQIAGVIVQIATAVASARVGRVLPAGFSFGSSRTARLSDLSKPLSAYRSGEPL
jgi:hypothetical protein